MKNVMTRAWAIAKAGQKNFGGKVKEYFAQALVIAWSEKKSMDNQLAAIKAKGLSIYNEYVKSLLNRGAELVSKTGTDVVISIPEKGYRKNVSISFEMSDFDVFAKTIKCKHVQYFNLGKAM